MTSDKNNVASRVTVLDARELDIEIHNILKDQYQNIVKYLPPGFLSKYEAEIDTLIRIIIWKISLYDNHATFGQQMLKLKYDNQATRKKLAYLGIWTIGLNYLKEKHSDILVYTRDTKIGDTVRNIFDWGENIIKILDLISFIIFLRKGKGVLFFERFLGIYPISLVPSSSRSIGYTYMTRELLWHGFVELLVFIVPFINYYSLMRKVRSYLPHVSKEEIKTSSECIMSLDTTCPLCLDTPILPHHMGCAHVFCYYCLASNRAADKYFECPRCGYSNSEETAFKPVIINK